MKNTLVILSFAAMSLTACQKTANAPGNPVADKAVLASSETGSYIKYTIAKGEQYCDGTALVFVKCQQLNFKVKFDSSAIYQTVLESNQDDINKLFGFSDNNALHHDYSARFGWRWSDNALRLFGYTYNKGVMSFMELGAVDIGAENTCSIKVTNDTYVFTLNGKETSMPRQSSTTLAEGYKLYPYFGGDETAPHTISIWIREL